MTLEEYKEIRNANIKEHEKQLKALAKEYAMSNNTVKIGDIVSNGLCKIKVERIDCSIGLRGNPMCIYSWPRLTKNLVPYKNGDTESIWQNYLVKEQKKTVRLF